MVILMNDFREMFEDWSDFMHDYDPDYPIDGGKDDESNQPIDPDKWADKDTEGGF